MADKKRVLILTSSLGFGHTSAAKAIAAALEPHADTVDVTIANPVEHENTSDILKDIHDLYDQSAKREGL